MGALEITGNNNGSAAGELLVIKNKGSYMYGVR